MYKNNYIHKNSDNVADNPEIKNIRFALNNIDGIIAAYIFGSAAHNKQNKLSDIDIAVLLKDVDFFDCRLRIHHDIAILTKKEVDVVVLNTVRNLYLIDSIINRGILLIDKDREQRIDYELSLSHAILDYKTFRNRLYAK